MLNTALLDIVKKYVSREDTTVTIRVPGEDPLFTFKAEDLTTAKAFEADAWWLLECVLKDAMGESALGRI